MIAPKLRVHKKFQRGVTLIESMVGIAVGLIILAGVVALSANTSRVGIQNLRLAKLNQELRSAMDIMVSDIRRAGFAEVWEGTAALDVDDLDDILLEEAGVINIPSSNCIVYRYDEDEDFTIVDDNTYGFRYDAANQEIDMRNNSADVSDCSGSGADWPALTSDNIEVTAFSVEFASFDADDTPAQCQKMFFDGSSIVTDIGGGVPPEVCSYSLSGGSCNTSGEYCYTRRSILISITGQIPGDPESSLQLESLVKVRNDHYFRVP